MRPTGHLSASTIFIGFIYYFNPSTNITLVLAFLFGSLVIDIDYTFRFVLEEENHRTYFSHYLPFWLSLILIFSLFQVRLGIFFTAGAIFHLLFDWFDWGLPMVPHTHNSPLTPHLLKKPNKIMPESYYFSQYWKNPIIIGLEIALLIFAILTLFFVPFELVLIILLFGFVTYGEFLFRSLIIRSQLFS